MEKEIDGQLKRELPFDLYGRYAVIRDIIDHNRKDGQRFKVLDVGGRGNLLKRFLPNDDVFYLDPLIDSKDDNFIKGDGCAMSLEAESFDWVTSADVFEHIPKEKRESFLNENIRVAKFGTILVAPFWSKEVEQAEINANENFKTLSGGQDHIWLKEHIENGLPDSAELERYLKDKELSFQKLNNNRLFLWQALIDICFLSYVNTDEDIKKKYEDFNYFYNSEVCPFDDQEPSYRKIYFIKKDQTLRNVKVEKKPMDDKLFLEAIKRGMELVNMIDNMNKGIIRQKDEAILSRDEKIQEKIRNMESIKSQSDLKSMELSEIHRSKGWRMVLFVRRILNKAFPRGSYRRKMAVMITRPRQSKDAYKRWIAKNETYDIRAVKMEIDSFTYKPKISVITPVYNVDSKWLDRCIKSVTSQFYENWEFCLYDDASTDKKTVKCLESWRNYDPRIKISFGKTNKHISGASNSALGMATGEFVALLDNDDTLSSFALFEVVKLLNTDRNVKYIYSDEDKIDKNENRAEPFFKPDWSPDLLLSCGYTNHLSIYEKKIIEEVGGLRTAYSASQDYDLVLRVIERLKDTEIVHIPKILYHWRSIPGSTARDPLAKEGKVIVNAKRAIEDSLKRRGISGNVVDGLWPSSYRVKRQIKGNPLVSIIIPTKDRLKFLKKCIESIKDKTTYKNYEIVVVDNGSTDTETVEYINGLPYEVIVLGGEFNFSKMNNIAAQKAQGDYLVFLNNDTEVITGDWIESMLEHAQRKKVGAVGCKLVYPNKSIQHAGVVLGMSPDPVTGVAGHIYNGLGCESRGYFGMVNVIRDCSAVTAAAMMMRKAVFDKVGGFNEELRVCYNDVDLCLRLREKGYLVVYTPYAELYHYESISRGLGVDRKEAEYMLTHWKGTIKNDPYYSPNLSLRTPYCAINI